MMHNGINSVGLDSIESWFRDPEKAKIIESEVRNYEKRVEAPLAPTRKPPLAGD